MPPLFHYSVPPLIHRMDDRNNGEGTHWKIHLQNKHGKSVFVKLRQTLTGVILNNGKKSSSRRNSPAAAQVAFMSSSCLIVLWNRHLLVAVSVYAHRCHHWNCLLNLYESGNAIAVTVQPRPVRQKGIDIMDIQIHWINEHTSNWWQCPRLIQLHASTNLQHYLLCRDAHHALCTFSPTESPWAQTKQTNLITSFPYRRSSEHGVIYNSHSKSSRNPLQS